MKYKTTTRVVSGVLGIAGFAMLGTIFISFARDVSNARQEYPSLISPVGSTFYQSSKSFELKSAPQVASTSAEGGVDYTKAINWFPEANSNSQFAESGDISFYTISIPELKIDSAAVAIGGEDLTNNLIQFPGTALPGKKGNSVLFGHSILPVFYNPKDYISIFSKIDTLSKGSEILVNYDGITYTYRVKEMFRVKPTDVYILDQTEQSEYLSLVTCFPMGDPRKPERLVVKAKLES